MESDAPEGLSRRDIIKRGAVAGAVVWATPVLTSTAAGALSPGSVVCSTYYAIRFDSSGVCQDSFNGEGFEAIVTALDGLGFPIYRGGCVGVTNTSITGTISSVTFTTNPGWKLVYTVSKQGNDAVAADDTDRVGTITVDPSGFDNVSNIVLVLCGPADAKGALIVN